MDVNLYYNNELSNYTASVTIDEMSETQYDGEINGTQLRFTDTNYSDTNVAYMITFKDADGNIVTEDVFNNNKLIEIMYTVVLQDGSLEDIRVLKFEET